MQASTSIQLPESSINFLRFLSYFYTMDWIAFIAIIASLLLIGFFAGIEIAFISANKLSIELNRKQGTKSGKVWGFYADRPARFIGTTLVGINLVFVVYGLLVVDMLSPMWQGIKSWSFLPDFLKGSVDYIKLFVETIVSTLIVLFIEFLFKAFFESFYLLNLQNVLLRFKMKKSLIRVIIRIKFTLEDIYNRSIYSSICQFSRKETNSLFCIFICMIYKSYP